MKCWGSAQSESHCCVFLFQEKSLTRKATAPHLAQIQILPLKMRNSMMAMEKILWEMKKTELDWNK